MEIKTKFKIGDRVYNRIYDGIREVKDIMIHTYKTKNGNIRKRIFYMFIGYGDTLIEQKDCCKAKEECSKCSIAFADCESCSNFLSVRKNKNKENKSE